MEPPLLAPPLAPGCPWSGFTAPNVDWCEAELCAWVTNPANTWSNLAYVAVGVWIIARVRRGRPELSLFGPASIAVGIFSGVYHASYTFALQILDFVGMFLFCFLPITQNALRLGWIGASSRLAWYLAGTALMTALVPAGFALGFPIQALVLFLILAIVGQEWLLAGRSRPRPDYRTYALALALITAAAVCSVLDVTRVWCDPDDHWLQGHAAWHVLSALSLAALYRFYQGLGPDPAREPPARRTA